jgi:hypothetical protein
VEECCKWRTVEWPPEALDWRGWLFTPAPEGGIDLHKGGEKPYRITLTGYSGMQRDVIKALIKLTGAEPTNTMSKDNTHLISARPQTQKHTAALSWGIAAVNHLWYHQPPQKDQTVDFQITDLPCQTPLKRGG